VSATTVGNVLPRMAAVALRLLSAGFSLEPCGCFGDSGTNQRRHLVLDLVGAAMGITAMFSSPGSVTSVPSARPGGVCVRGRDRCLAWLGTLAVTVLPQLTGGFRPTHPGDQAMTALVVVGQPC